jgi:hypothetical protein
LQRRARAASREPNSAPPNRRRAPRARRRARRRPPPPAAPPAAPPPRRPRLTASARRPSSIPAQPLQDNAGACSNAVPGSIQVPPEAVLYLSLTATGDVSYTCGPDGKPDLGNVREEAALANANKEFNPEGWSGKAFFNPDGNLQFDLAALEPAAATTVVLAKDIATAPSTFSPVPEARWSVLSTDGDVLPTAPAGLPQIAFVTRTTVDEGKIAKCPAGTTVKAPFTVRLCAGVWAGALRPLRSSFDTKE